MVFNSKRLSVGLQGVLCFVIGLLVCSMTYLDPIVPRIRIVLITVDTLRSDCLLAKPRRAPAMPRLMARSKAGLRFDRFYVPVPVTQSSHATMFTGLHPWQHGVSNNGIPLAKEHETLAERLRNAGFSTSAIVASFPVSAPFGFDQGFDTFDDCFTRGAGMFAWDLIAPDQMFYSLAEDVTQAALAELDRRQDPRQFYWLHYFDPHEPYGDTTAEPVKYGFDVVGPRVYDGQTARRQLRQVRRLYDADVRSMDRSLDRLLRRLDRDSEAYETHILLTADHGESFGEDGSMGHGTRLTPAQLHVPCVLLSPRVRPGVRLDVAGSIDVMPTMLALAGLPAPPGAGRSLLEPPQDPPQVLGMRPSFETPWEELRLDGRIHTLYGEQFYLLDQTGTLYVGNSQSILPPSPAPPPGTGRDLAEVSLLFRGIEGELKRRSKDVPPLAPELREALLAMGYLE